jgi:hypothetical protein
MIAIGVAHRRDLEPPLFRRSAILGQGSPHHAFVDQRYQERVLGLVDLCENGARMTVIPFRQKRHRDPQPRRRPGRHEPPVHVQSQPARRLRLGMKQNQQPQRRPGTGTEDGVRHLGTTLLPYARGIKSDAAKDGTRYKNDYPSSR